LSSPPLTLEPQVPNAVPNLETHFYTVGHSLAAFEYTSVEINGLQIVWLS